MKKIFIYILLLFVSFNIFAQSNTFDFSLVLSPNSSEINSINNLNKDTEIINIIEDFNYSNFETNIFNYISNLLNKYFLEIPLNPNLKKIKIEKLKKENIKNNNLKNESILNSYSNTLNLEELNDIDDIKTDDVNIEEIFPTFKKNNATLLNSLLLQSEDKIIIQSILDNLVCDAIFLISIDKISTYNKLKIEYITNNERYILYNKIIIDNLINNLEEDLLLTFLNFFNDNYSTINTRNTHNILSLSSIENISKERLEKTDNYDNVKIRENDIIKLNEINNYVFLKKGVHFLQIKSIDKTKIIKIDLKDEMFDLVYEKNNIILDNLNLMSKIGTLDFYINGQYVDTSSSINIKEIELPIYIEATKEGYIPSLIQLNQELNNLNIELNPIWKGNSQNLEKAQDEFYSSLLSYVLLSFTTLSINNINDAIGNSKFDSAIEVLSTSLTIYSSINIANKLISYIKLAIK